jgi:hypothetical protein
MPLCLSLLRLPARGQGEKAVQLSIEPVPGAIYDQDSTFPIRCHFKNISSKPVTLILPGLGSRQALLTGTLGFEIRIKKAGENGPVIDIQYPSQSQLCENLTQAMDYDIECNSPGDKVELRSQEEFVRTIHLRSPFGGPSELAKGLKAGKYTIQVISRQADLTLVSNEASIKVRAVQQ